MKSEKAGEYAFLVVLVVAILAGLASPVITASVQGAVSALLVVLGIIVGLTMISEKEVTSFLVATVALIVASAASNPTYGFTAIDSVAKPVGTILNAIVNNIAVFAAPAAVLLAAKSIYAIARKK